VIEAPRLFTSHWRNPELRNLDATIIGISRGTPRGNPGFRYRVVRELAPSREAFALSDPEEFERVYRTQLEELGAEAILSRLEEISGGKAAVLLCWERPHEPWCHRWQLAGFLEREAGVQVRELRAGMLPARFELRLFDREEDE